MQWHVPSREEAAAVQRIVTHVLDKPLSVLQSLAASMSTGGASAVDMDAVDDFSNAEIVGALQQVINVARGAASMLGVQVRLYSLTHLLTHSHSFTHSLTHT